MTKLENTYKLRAVFSGWKSGNGLFKFFTSPPWGGEVSSNILDMLYFGSHSGFKTASGLVLEFCSENGTLTGEARAAIAQSVEAKFKNNWSRLWEAAKSEYNPIDNYNRIEDSTDTESRDLYKTQDNTNTQSGSISDDGSATPENDVTSTRYTYPFNSDSESAIEKVVNSPDSKISTENTRTYNNVTEIDSGGSTDKGNIISTKKSVIRGNIGVTTTQQMLQQEFELWKWNFYESVFNDIDSILSIAVARV